MIIEKIWRQLVLRRLEGSDEVAELAAQAGKVLHLRAGVAVLAFRIGEQGAPVPAHPGITPAAVLTFDVQGMMRGKPRPPHAQGDSELLSALGNLRDRLDFSAMDLVEEAFGERAACAATMVGDGVRSWGGDARARMGRNMRSWLANESGMFATRTQLAHLAEQTAQLAERACELAERASALDEQKVGA